jgi:hypothetical protein
MSLEEAFITALEKVNGVYVSNGQDCLSCGNDWSQKPRAAIVSQELDLGEGTPYSCFGVVLCQDCNPSKESLLMDILIRLRKLQGDIKLDYEE